MWVAGTGFPHYNKKKHVVFSQICVRRTKEKEALQDMRRHDTTHRFMPVALITPTQEGEQTLSLPPESKPKRTKPTEPN